MNKELIESLPVKSVAEYVFYRDPDLRNPYKKDDKRYHEFNRYIFDLEVKERGL